MNASELHFLTGCLGIHGETRMDVIRGAVRHHGTDKPVHWTSVDKQNKGDVETAGAVFKRLFAEAA